MFDYQQDKCLKITKRSGVIPMQRLLRILVAFCALATLLSRSYASCEQYQQIIQISVPKAGTHLLAKCLHLITQRNPADIKLPLRPILDKLKHLNKHFDIPLEGLKLLTTLPSNEFWNTHLTYNEERAFFLNNKTFSCFFIYRDPRDQLVSLVYYLLKNRLFIPYVDSSDFDELLLNIILYGDSLVACIPPGVGGVDELYKSYSGWLNLPYITPIRFEDLVGPKGGGEISRQYHTIEKIATKLGLVLSDSMIMLIAENLFGESETFREGKIGEWKTHFKQIHKDAFKMVTGTLLQDLEYETTNNW